MTQEEKKAIEKIKELEKLTREESKERNPEETQKLYKEYADYYLILLNLIEKLQKENEELRQNYDTATTEIEELKEQKEIDMYMIGDSISKGIVKRDYIPKDKIRKLDNECFPRHKVGLLKGQRIMGTNECTYFAEKMLELLEED